MFKELPAIQSPTGQASMIPIPVVICSECGTVHPNIVNITYGRDVGYKIEQEVFDEKIHSISATKIRKEMGLK